MADLLAPFVGERALALAGQLIARFGGLARALVAEPDQMEEEIAHGCRLLRAAHRLTEGILREDLQGTPVRSRDGRLVAYLQALIGPSRDECFHAFYLDEKGGYLREETLSRGDATGVSFRQAPLFRRAIELGARQMIVAHNHLSDDCRPSEADITVTRRLAATAAAIEVRLVDHLIVTRTRAYSFAAGGLL